jgi:hypothetical protein
MRFPQEEIRMRTHNIFSNLGSFLLPLGLVLLLPAIAHASGTDPKVEKTSSTAAKNPAPAAKPREDQTKKVYTNDDFGWYRPSSSATQSDQSTETTSASSADASSSEIALYDPHQDPQWYAQQVTVLENDLTVIENRETALEQFRTTSSGLPTGLDLSAPVEDITTDGLIAQLESRREQIEEQLNDVADLARENGLPPGTVNQPSETAAPAPTIAEQRDAITEEYRDASDQLAATEATLDAMQQQAAAQNITLIPPTPGEGGNLTTNLVTNLNSQESALQNALSDAEDDARTLGVQPGDLR